MQFPRRSVTALMLVTVLAGCSSATPANERRGPAAATVELAAASVAPSTAAPAFPYEARGSDGVAVRLTKAPSRIVSLSAGATESLFAIGAGPRVVAVDRFSDFPEEARGRPKVDYTRPSVESLAALQPDLVLASGRQRDTVPALREAGLPVVLYEETATIAGVLSRIREYGRMTGQIAEADALAEQLDGRIRAVTARLGPVDAGPRVYHEISSALYSATPASFVGDFYTLLRARNIAAGATGAYPQLSQEVILQRDPEVIVLADGREGITSEQVRARTGWGTLTAVRTGRVYLLPDQQADMLSRPGPRVADGLEYLAKLLYPDRF